MTASSSSSTSYSSSDSSSDSSSSHAKRRHHRSNRRDRDRDSLKIRKRSRSLGNDVGESVAAVPPILTLPTTPIPPEVTVLRIVSMSSIIQRLLVEEGDRPKKKQQDKGNSSPVQLSKYLGHDKDGGVCHSTVSGKKILLKLDKSKEDKEAESKRNELLKFLNASFG